VEAVMLALSSLRDVPDELANRMMVAHGSRMLLRAMRGEPEPTRTLAETRPVLKAKAARPEYIPVEARPAIAMPPPVREIVALVADVMGLSTEDITGRARQRYITLARALACRLIRDRVNSKGEPLHSLPRIAAFMRRDHSTVSHALAMFDSYCRHFPELAEAYRVLTEKLEASR
jgi:hypothetical protein